ncbi:response regulator transcription factor [Agaribacterium haliotis]|uniref:response regulator transcription factor n=1 Tax=Agaribacterium haliotis TaxID=2013869 RepID=UPI001EFCA961|nr:response regulator [Agaribacterium haliotis]
MNKSLLIIEDDEVFARTLSRRLSKKGFNCLHANDSSAALLLARQSQAAFVVLDMKLHEKSGLQLLQPLRNILPGSRIVLLTGFASIATAVDAIKRGADDYLSKPIDTDSLVLSLLGEKKAGDDEHSQAMLSANQAEWEHIQQALKLNDGNISATARQLGMHRRTLQRKLQKRSPHRGEPGPLKTN